MHKIDYEELKKQTYDLDELIGLCQPESLDVAGLYKSLLTLAVGIKDLRESLGRLSDEYHGYYP